ncbi:MAG: hypothetical protein ABW203_03680 [Novosphingobium sp.]
MAGWVQRHAVLVLWAGWALVLLAASAPSIAGFAPRDPDDYMRLVEVWDLLAGQGWFDVSQHRMDPPAGAAMHWSRLVDLPLAAVLAAMRLVLAEPAASVATMTLVPLLQLLLLMVIVDRLMRVLAAGETARWLAAAIIPLFPLLASTFAPLRIDHHGWQGLAAAACALLLGQAPDRRAALLAGLVAAAWLAISLEALPLVALFAAAYGGRYWLWSDRSVCRSLAGLALAGPVLFLTTRPVEQLAVAWTDAVGWPHLLGFALAAIATAGATRWLPQTSPAQRGTALAAAAMLAAAAILVPLGWHAIAPFAGLDPVLRRYWFDFVREGLPIAAQPLSIKVMLLWPPGIVAAWWALVPQHDDPAVRRAWALLAALALGAAAISLAVMRAAINAQILAVPFAAALIAAALPRLANLRSSIPRALAATALVLVTTPTAATALAKRLNPLAPPPLARALHGYRIDESACAWGRLGVLHGAHLYATLDPAPEILARTGNSVVASGYHRNAVKMLEVTKAFSGDPARAEALVRASRPDYLVLCLTAGDIAVYRSRRPDNLANLLAAGRTPRWLVPVPGFDRGALRLYRVAQAGSNSIASPFMQ